MDVVALGITSGILAFEVDPVYLAQRFTGGCVIIAFDLLPASIMVIVRRVVITHETEVCSNVVALVGYHATFQFRTSFLVQAKVLPIF